MGRVNFNKNLFKGGSLRGNEVICYGCKITRHLKNECPLNKKAKRYKMKKKILVETWFDYDSSLSDNESMNKARANFCLREKYDKVCNKDDFDDLDTFNMSMITYLMIFKNLCLSAKF